MADEDVDFFRNLNARDFFDIMEEQCGENIILIGLKTQTDESYSYRIAVPPFEQKEDVIRILQDAIDDIKEMEW